MHKSPRAPNPAAALARELAAKPRISPIDHWRKVYASAKPGTISFRLASQALEELYHKAEREPGCDDE